MTSYHEGSPMIIKEAMSCNTPIISVDVGDVGEMIRNIDGCYLINNRSVEAIVKSLKKCIENPKKTNSRKHAKNIDLNKINAKLISVYTKILQESNS